MGDESHGQTHEASSSPTPGPTSLPNLISICSSYPSALCSAESLRSFPNSVSSLKMFPVSGMVFLDFIPGEFGLPLLRSFLLPPGEKKSWCRLLELFVYTFKRAETRSHLCLHS